MHNTIPIPTLIYRSIIHFMVGTPHNFDPLYTFVRCLHSRHALSIHPRVLLKVHPLQQMLPTNTEWCVRVFFVLFGYGLLH